jgi:hypothetical protein
MRAKTESPDPGLLKEVGALKGEIILAKTAGIPRANGDSLWLVWDG